MILTSTVAIRNQIHMGVSLTPQSESVRLLISVGLHARQAPDQRPSINVCMLPLLFAH